MKASNGKDVDSVDLAINQFERAYECDFSFAEKCTCIMKVINSIDKTAVGSFLYIFYSFD